MKPDTVIAVVNWDSVSLQSLQNAFAQGMFIVHQNVFNIIRDATNETSTEIIPITMNELIHILDGA